jgi:exosortase
LVNLARHHWSTSDGAHGPIILVSGLWLLLRDHRALTFRPASLNGAWLLLAVPLLLAAIYGRSFRLLGVESAAVYLTLVLLAAYYWGLPAIRRNWVAIAYLGFVVKPPDMLVAEWTQPLKIAISEASVGILQALDYPIAASGVLIQIAQYELLVQQACAGLGSLVTLLAMGMVYVHLSRPDNSWHAAALLLLIVPIALLANLLRVLMLVLLTYHVSDGVAQSFAHDLAGMITFLLSLGGMLAADAALRAWSKQP